MSLRTPGSRYSWCISETAYLSGRTAPALSTACLELNGYVRRQKRASRMSSSDVASHHTKTIDAAVAAAPVLDRWAAITGRLSFGLSIALGFAVGLLLPPIAGNHLFGAIISLGAICIAA